MFINDVPAEIEPGKKEGTFAIRETPEMYGARLLQDIGTRPDFYFARREVAYSDLELEDFAYSLWNIARTINEMERLGRFYKNEQSCENPFKCPYRSICFNCVKVGPGDCPPGFYRQDAVQAVETTIGSE